MIYIKIVSYTFQVNGGLTDAIQIKRGLSQGDPMLPLHFYSFDGILAYMIDYSDNGI